MSVLIFNGEMERRATSTSFKIGEYLKQLLEKYGETVTVFNLGEWNIPVFDPAVSGVPEQVQSMAAAFRNSKLQIWLTPLYHGSMTGAMKNAFDWLEITARETPAYLTNKFVGLVCWAGGTHAMQGINAMDSVVKALRAWTVPYSIPAMGCDLLDSTGKITVQYERKFGMLVKLLTETTAFHTNNQTATLI